MLSRLGVVAEGGDVEGLVVVGDPDLGLFGRRLAVVGIVLGEARGRRALPDGLVQAAVQRRWAFRAVGLDDLLAGLGLGQDGLLALRCEQEPGLSG